MNALSLCAIADMKTAHKPGVSLHSGPPASQLTRERREGLRQSSPFATRLACHLRNQLFGGNPDQAKGEANATNPFPYVRDLDPLSPVRWRELEGQLIEVVYGSNAIETAGTTRRLTAKVCREVFSIRDNDVMPDIAHSHPDYKEYLEHLTLTGRAADKQNILKERREVINHVKALISLIDTVVLENHPLDVQLILRTHKILHQGLDDEVIAGGYRDHEVAVSYSEPGKKRQRSICIRASSVPAYMREMELYLQNDMMVAERLEEIDPYALAARYHHRLAMIHPFGDGNGRMSRLLLNVLLLKYAGHVVPLGASDDKEEYLGMVRRAHKVFSREDMEVEFYEQSSHLEFAGFLSRRAGLEPGTGVVWKNAGEMEDVEVSETAVQKAVEECWQEMARVCETSTSTCFGS